MNPDTLMVSLLACVFPVTLVSMKVWSLVDDWKVSRERDRAEARLKEEAAERRERDRADATALVSAFPGHWCDLCGSFAVVSFDGRLYQCAACESNRSWQWCPGCGDTTFTDAPYCSKCSKPSPAKPDKWDYWTCKKCGWTFFHGFSTEGVCQKCPDTTTRLDVILSEIEQV